MEAADALAYRVVLDYFLPLAIPLLLFRTNLHRVLHSTGVLLLAFLLGSGSRRAERCEHTSPRLLRWACAREARTCCRAQQPC